MRSLRNRKPGPDVRWREVGARALGGREPVREAPGALDRFAPLAGAVGEVGRVDAGGSDPGQIGGEWHRLAVRSRHSVEATVALDSPVHEGVTLQDVLS